MPELEDLYEAVENKDAYVALSIIREPSLRLSTFA